MTIETIDAARMIRGALAVLALCGGGFAGGEAIDLFDAQSWKEEHIEELMRAERDRERLVALEAQAKLLVRLVHECQRGEMGEIEEPEEPNVVAPWGVIE